ncbi:MULTISPECIES: biotin synthase auxiliary protein BsaP [Corynebacterium]|uniref:Biotin synthase auxiliary protein n=1 Tax=Corynebacterium lipophiloflavum (strain ATCC 700352 / DSM 44291 / CCUG 37336 / JCM 10383 / DMMZ 1944) TaxID=525263 RepID=C0XTQ9_CORLD|nr:MULTISPECIES: hypothetical protein [Corynebacterium]EEI16385.1 hypothetical protein HMPREF0298_1829 [Corynebacterium lipophiloflavum DSM 44291]MCT1463951.1 hypothetical protein [Corynebacterium sanguinis]MCT2023900.1 hypothetical protein [Corynebacterium sanguinis]MCT2330207.1 hypothetical protein [Corynebacterium sanguinis]
MRIPESTELADAILSGEAKFSHPAGREWDVPRICPLCERRMVVKLNPVGWEAMCSRHGLFRSEWLQR